MSNTPSDLIRVHCPCGARMKVRSSSLGRKAKCPTCEEVFVIAKDAPAKDQPIDMAPAEAAQSQDSLLEELARQERQQVAVSPAESPSNPSDACPKCGTRMPGHAVMCVSCGFNTQTGRIVKGTSTKEVALEATMAERIRLMASGSGTFILGCVFSGIGALVGAGIWFGIAISSGYEIGWIAWILGAFAGYGMHLGYKDETFSAGFTAAAFSVFGIFAAKLMIFVFMVNAVIFGNTNDVDMQREFIVLIRTEEKLDEKKIWSEENREEAWDSYYDMAHHEVESMADEAVVRKFEELKSEQEIDTDVDNEKRVKQNRLAYHQSVRRADHLGLGYYGNKRNQIYEEESIKINLFDETELDQKIAQLDQWEKEGKWTDQDYVGDQLIFEFVGRDFANDPKYKDKDMDLYELSRSRWKRLYDPAKERVDALDFETQAQQLKEILQQQEDDSKRFRLTYHHQERMVQAEGLSYSNEKREEIYNQLEKDYALLSSEELDTEIRELDEWVKSGKASDYSYLRNELIYMHINLMVAQRRSQHDSDSEGYWMPSEQEWEEFYSIAEDKVDSLPDNDLAAQIKLAEQEQERFWQTRRDAMESEEAIEIAGELAGAFMETMFSPFDALFIILAVGSAFKIAIGGSDN